MGGAHLEIVEQASPLPFEATLERLTAAIGAAGLTIFASIDHAAGARDAGLTMPPATLLIYGHASGGTPLMLAAPLVALDLPLRVLVHEHAGAAMVAFRPIGPMMMAHGVPEALASRLQPAQALLLRALQA